MSLHLAGSKELLLGKVSDAFVAARNASVAEVEFVAIVWESISMLCDVFEHSCWFNVLGQIKGGSKEFIVVLGTTDVVVALMVGHDCRATRDCRGL